MRKLVLAAAAAFICVQANAGTVHPKPDYQTYETGRIVHVEPRIRYVDVNEPVTQCKTVQEIQRIEGKPSDGGTIIGMIVGGVVGNQIGKGSGRDAATAVGAMTGAVVGTEMSKKDDYVLVDRQKCTTTNHTVTKRVTDGYFIRVKMNNGQEIYLLTNDQYVTGEKIEVGVTYTLVK